MKGGRPARSVKRRPPEKVTTSVVRVLAKLRCEQGINYENLGETTRNGKRREPILSAGHRYDLFLLRFVLRTEDKSRKIGAALEIVDDDPLDLRSERSQDRRGIATCYSCLLLLRHVRYSLYGNQRLSPGSG